jgi:hypothetical protein
MCDFQDALNREVSRDISIFETASIEELDGKQVPRVALDLAVKKYMRSAADRTFSADEVRTPEAIERTIDYLITQVLDLDTAASRIGFLARKYAFTEIYIFLRDRLRAVRQDLALQGLGTTRVFIEAHEICIRFLIMADQFCCGQERALFDPKQNNEQLAQSFQPLHHAYEDAREAEEADEPWISPNEPELEAYFLLMCLNDEGEVLNRLRMLPPDLLHTEPIRFARRVALTFINREYPRALCWTQGGRRRG